MSVYVHHEPDRFKSFEAEDCVDCHKPTRYWLDPHIPLCPDCAKKRSSEPVCPRCGNVIDPEVCWCGDLVSSHHTGSGHSPVPLGCECGYITPPLVIELADAAWTVLNHDNDPHDGQPHNTANWNKLCDRIKAVLKQRGMLKGR